MKKYLKKTIQMLCPELLIYYRYRRYLRMPKMQYPEEMRQIYTERTGFDLNLENPQRFTEKIQWRKLNDDHDIYALLSDKYAVRAWITEKIGAEYLIPLLGVWSDPNKIPFQELPQKFVLKTNNGSHTNIIVRDKCQLNIKNAKRQLKEWLHTPFWFNNGFEMQYKKIKPQVIAEQYMEPDPGTQDLTDYKFYCFHGVPTYCQVIRNRSEQETIDFYDMDWNHMEFTGMNCCAVRSDVPASIPYSFREMCDVARKLSSSFAFVRVDLYEVNRKVYFGEMTFTPGGGYGHFTPGEWDYKLGALWDICVEQVNEGIIAQ